MLLEWEMEQGRPVEGACPSPGALEPLESPVRTGPGLARFVHKALGRSAEPWALGVLCSGASRARHRLPKRLSPLAPPFSQRHLGLEKAVGCSQPLAKSVTLGQSV